ncbi:MAG: ArsR family transcriptional regulator [Gammaproteobacteria bacterium]|nr:MAG: ArsR family transcriptional regulator [Gammaproteobacteria bacterium]
MDATRFFSILGHPVRLRALVLLQREGELCVCELTHALGLLQPVVSRHLALLREAGLVDAHREGQWMHYRLAPGLPSWQREVLEQTATALGGQEPYVSDAALLGEMPNRPGSRCCA